MVVNVIQSFDAGTMVRTLGKKMEYGFRTQVKHHIGEVETGQIGGSKGVE